MRKELDGIFYKSNDDPPEGQGSSSSIHYSQFQSYHNTVKGSNNISLSSKFAQEFTEQPGQSSTFLELESSADQNQTPVKEKIFNLKQKTIEKQSLGGDPAYNTYSDQKIKIKDLIDHNKGTPYSFSFRSERRASHVRSVRPKRRRIKRACSSR